MKATGIIRKIDDLGRIVIPKEIRRSMRIREGDPLEIYTNRDGEVIFKKYSLLEGVEDFAANLCDTLSRDLGCICAVADRDVIVAVAGGGRRELLERRLSPELEKLMAARRLYRSGEGEAVPVLDSGEKYRVSAACPILTEGDVAGSVLLVTTGDTAADDTACRLLQVLAAFLGKHMEG